MIDDWWADDPSEIFWMENTDRPDLGENLKAPQTNETGKEYWGYSLLKQLKPGHVVLHYDKRYGAITHFSTIEDTYFESQIFWKARGLFARKSGVVEKLQPSFEVPIYGFSKLKKPITKELVHSKQDLIGREYQNLGNPPYKPFDKGVKRHTGPSQTYMSKFPKFMIELFEIEELTGIAPSDSGDSNVNTSRLIEKPNYAMRSIKIRRGGARFRAKLISEYKECMFTGCKEVDVLEACHIVPYSISYDNSIENGLLLRSDIHVLFDLGKLDLDQECRIRVTGLLEDEYNVLQGKKVEFSKNADMKTVLENIRSRV